MWGGGPLTHWEGSNEGAVPLSRNFFLLLALKMVSFGVFWVIFLHLSCLFTTYANIMPVCVTDSDKPNE